MSMRERSARVRLDGQLPRGQVEIVREIVLCRLIGGAGDLRLLNRLPDPKRAVREVAALGRLAFWLSHGEILVPDRIAREVMVRLAREVDGTNRQGEGTGGDPAAERDAMRAFVKLLSDRPASAEVGDALSPGDRATSSEPGGGCGETATEQTAWVRLDDLADRHLAILREEADRWRVTKAEDLPKHSDDIDVSKREAEEVAALGRLVSGLWSGEVPADRIVRELVARSTGETILLDELKEEYDRVLTEHQAWVALLSLSTRRRVQVPGTRRIAAPSRVRPAAATIRSQPLLSTATGSSSRGGCPRISSGSPAGR